MIEGYHSCIFAYGQTGSGKTYTMENYDYALSDLNNKPFPIIKPYSEGLVHKSVHELFLQLKNYKVQNNVEVRVFVSFLQIYNEKIFDLLNMKNANDISSPLQLRWTKEDQFSVDGLFLGECVNEEDAIALYNSGIKNRCIATHKLNIASSRSHTIFSITVHNYQNVNANNNTYSKLQFVDLAGSERSATAESHGKHLRESIDINKSLLVLRRIILNLADKKQKKYIPYRESKLTSLLKQSFGGNAFCIMIACLSPSDNNYEENISTLNYAAKAADIINEPTKNEDPTLRLIEEQKKSINQQQKDLQSANEYIAWVTDLLKQKLRETGQPEELPQYPGYNPPKMSSIKISHNPSSFLTHNGQPKMNHPTNNHINTLVNEVK